MACKSNKQPSNSTSSIDTSKNISSVEVFEQFNKKFFTDSVFQLSRTIFPLPGAWSAVIYGDAKVDNQETDKYLVKNNNFFWKKKGWRYITHTKDTTGKYYFTFERKDSIMREQILTKETDDVITYIFKLVDKKWFLTYFGVEWY